MDFQSLNFREPSSLSKAGYVRLAGPYNGEEQDMLGRLIADAKRANKGVAFSGSPKCVEVWQIENQRA